MDLIRLKGYNKKVPFILLSEMRLLLIEVREVTRLELERRPKMTPSREIRDPNFKISLAHDLHLYTVSCLAITLAVSEPYVIFICAYNVKIRMQLRG